MAIKQYRPYIPSVEVDYIAQLLAKSDPIDSTPEITRYHNSLVRKWKLLSFKVGEGLVKAAREATPKLSIADKLELDSSELGQNHEAKRRQLYNLWVANPLSLSPDQIEQVDLYRWENDLMSPEEEQAYDEKISAT